MTRILLAIASVIVIALCLQGCTASRVLVKDCQELVGMDGHKNCELVQKY